MHYCLYIQYTTASQLPAARNRVNMHGGYEQVWKTWSQQDVTSLLDICPANEPGEQLEMLRCIQIGLLCVKDDPQLRPTMASVVHMLNSPSMTLAQPTEPVFAATGQRPSMAAPEPSINEASVSQVEPR